MVTTITLIRYCTPITLMKISTQRGEFCVTDALKVEEYNGGRVFFQEVGRRKYGRRMTGKEKEKKNRNK